VKHERDKIFADAQPVYAPLGIPTFPFDAVPKIARLLAVDTALPDSPAVPHNGRGILAEKKNDGATIDGTNGTLSQDSARNAGMGQSRRKRQLAFDERANAGLHPAGNG